MSGRKPIREWRGTELEGWADSCEEASSKIWDRARRAIYRQPDPDLVLVGVFCRSVFYLAEEGFPAAELTAMVERIVASWADYQRQKARR